MELTTEQYVTNRAEMIRFVPAGAQRVLDVGCGQGLFGLPLKNAIPNAEIWGVDPVGGERPPAYARFIEGYFPDAIPRRERFDCVVFNDVLEHMVDPWAALKATKDMLSAGGVIVASLPNIRNVRTIRSLVFGGQWRYVDAGVLDRTHLRFFTAASMRDLFTDSGYAIRHLGPINLPRVGRRGLIRKALLGKADEFFAEQFAVVAVPLSETVL